MTAVTAVSIARYGFQSCGMQILVSLYVAYASCSLIELSQLSLL